MDQIFTFYDKFLSLFPDNWHTLVSVALLIIMVLLIIRYIKVGAVGVLLLVIFIPASIPLLRQIGLAIFELVKHILGTK